MTDPQPNGFWCVEECPNYDGKRCELLGTDPNAICEPAVREAFTLLENLRADEWTARRAKLLKSTGRWKTK
jgi:hypothetical protein